MDVARSLADGVRDERVHQLDDRGLLRLPEERDVGSVVLLLLDDLDLVFHPLHHVLEARDRVVRLVDRFLDGGIGGHDRLDLEAGDELDVVDREDVAGIGHGYGEPAAASGDRNDLELVGHVTGDQLGDGVVGGEVRQIDCGYGIELREELGEALFRDRAELDQRLRDASAGGLDLLLGLLQRVRWDELGFQQLESDVFLLHGCLPLLFSFRYGKAGPRPEGTGKAGRTFARPVPASRKHPICSSERGDQRNCGNKARSR